MAGTPNLTPSKGPKNKKNSRCPERTHVVERGGMPTLYVRRPDVQGAVGVIGRIESLGTTIRADLEETDLRIADLEDLQLSWAHFNGANLEGANLNNSKLDGATFDTDGDNYCPTLLDWAYADSASLVGADLTGASLMGANFTDAHLEKAILDKANLSGATLNGANLKDAGLNGTILKGATTDSQTTTWPENFDWKAAGVVEDT
jgi:uncharacterized protein YjbI with pentapeptide repeats